MSISRRRATLCCTECKRRKLKCSRSLPCDRCVEHNIQETCRRGNDLTQSWQVQVEDFVDMNARVRLEHASSRAQDLGDTILQHTIQDSSSQGLGNSASFTTPPRACDDAMSRARPAETPNDREVIDAATILEFLAWGRKKQVDFTTALPPCNIRSTAAEPLTPDSATKWPTPVDHTSRDDTLNLIQILLPDRRKTYELVKYHVDSLLWYHGSFHGPTFLRQLDKFYEENQGQIGEDNAENQWAALLFAILTATMCCASTRMIREWGFKAAEQSILSQQWRQATIKCLEAADYMSNFSVLSCQAVATLTMSAHLLGFSDQQAVLLASVTRIAQGLGLHRLDEASDRTILVETGRRLWSQLCTQDWFSIPFSECYLISPLHTSSCPPLHCDDESLEDLPMERPAITSYCRYLHSISGLMPSLQDSVENSNTLFTKYEQVLTFDRAVRNLVAQQRPAFLSNISIEPEWPTWVPWARSAAAISSSHKIIMVHRKFLSISFTNNAFAFTRRTCVAAAKTILKEFQKTVTEDGPMLWIYHAFSVAAAITLCLEILHSGPRSPAYSEHHRLIMATIRLFEEAVTSKIASRGALLLSRLMSASLVARTSNQTCSASKRLYSTSGDQGSGKRQKITQLLSAVNYWHSGSDHTSQHGAAIESVDEDDLDHAGDSASATCNNVADTNQEVNTGLEEIDYRDYLATSSFGNNNHPFSRLDASLASGTVDAFESLLNFTHNYGSRMQH